MNCMSEKHSDQIAEEIKKRLMDCIPARLQRPDLFPQYLECVMDLMDHDTVKRMNQYIQHGDVTTLKHCILVSYRSYLLCRMIGLDYRSAARGGLLHDLFLYDWHEKDDDRRGLHAFRHPYVALANANGAFALNDMEQDIIKKHMWPLTVVMPKFPETLIVSTMDKYSAIVEFFKN